MSWVKEPHLKKTFAEIESATQSFKTVIGNGGFGEVYKGELFISRVLTSVAVKRLNSRLTGQGLKEFLTEIHLLSECKHPNLISLLAYCQEGNENILVYELAEHGSLDRYLSSDNTSYILPWLQRIKICLGAARGLHYLHNRVGEHHRIIHRDIKSANILLDRNWEAKIADLGLSKIGLANQNNSFLISNVCGTLGYCDPAYMSTGILTKESDVYSFGVVLFEVLCGRLNFLNTNDERRFLSPLARRYYEAKKLDEIIDPKIRKQMDSDSLYKFSAIAYKCLLLERAQRPSMSVVVEELEEALEFQEKINQGAENMRISDSESEVEMRNVVLRPPIDPSLDDVDISCVQIIRNEDLEELRELSSGSFWTVYHGRWRGTDVAIKRVKKSFFVGQSSEKERLAREFWREADILSKLHHPNIVAFYGVVQNGPEGRLATVTELMLDGSLRHLLLCKDRHLDRHKKLIIALDAAFGMDYLHSKKIIHFDLKCDNLLVNMKDSSRPICKVGDFGMSKIKQISLVSGGVRATLPWMAPELLNGSSNIVSEKVDVFSFGIVLWEILTGEEPYANMHYGAIIGGIVNNTLRPAIPRDCDPEWRRLMEECWEPNPMVRPSFTEIARRLRVMSAACQT